MGKNYVNNMPVNPSSGGGSRGGWADKFFGMFRARRMEELNRDRFAWQQGLITDEMSKRAMNAAAANAAGKVVGEKMSLKNRRDAAFAFEKKRTSRNKKTGELNFPDLYDFGPAEDPLNARWGSRAGERAAQARANAAAGKATPTAPGQYEPIEKPQAPATTPQGTNLQEPNSPTPAVTPKKVRKPRAPKAGA